MLHPAYILLVFLFIIALPLPTLPDSPKHSQPKG